MLSQPDPVVCRSIQASNAGTVAGVRENRQTEGWFAAKECAKQCGAVYSVRMWVQELVIER